MIKNGVSNLDIFSIERIIVTGLLIYDFLSFSIFSSSFFFRLYLKWSKTFVSWTTIIIFSAGLCYVTSMLRPTTSILWTQNFLEYKLNFISIFIVQSWTIQFFTFVAIRKYIHTLHRSSLKHFGCFRFLNRSRLDLSLFPINSSSVFSGEGLAAMF